MDDHNLVNVKIINDLFFEWIKMHLVQNPRGVKAARIQMNSPLWTCPLAAQFPLPWAHQFGGVLCKRVGG